MKEFFAGKSPNVKDIDVDDLTNPESPDSKIYFQAEMYDGMYPCKIVDEFIYEGLHCVITTFGTHPCCYVGVPITNSWFGKSEKDEIIKNIPCHGGITFSGEIRKSIIGGIDRSPYWYLGWDYVHGGDLFFFGGLSTPGKAHTFNGLSNDVKAVADYIIKTNVVGTIGMLKNVMLNGHGGTLQYKSDSIIEIADWSITIEKDGSWHGDCILKRTEKECFVWVLQKYKIDVPHVLCHIRGNIIPIRAAQNKMGNVVCNFDGDGELIRFNITETPSEQNTEKSDKLSTKKHKEPGMFDNIEI